MGLLDCASGASLWRGYDYHKSNKVNNLIETDTGIFTADVVGTASEPYAVEIDVAHPRKSKCNCPHADGKRIVCKHMVATYFAAYPEEAQRIYDEAMAYQAEEEIRASELSNKVITYVGKMKKDDLCQVLLEMLFDGPEWQYDRFVREHGLDE